MAGDWCIVEVDHLIYTHKQVQEREHMQVAVSSTLSTHTEKPDVIMETVKVKPKELAQPYCPKVHFQTQHSNSVQLHGFECLGTEKEGKKIKTNNMDHILVHWHHSMETNAAVPACAS